MSDQSFKNITTTYFDSDNDEYHCPHCGRNPPKFHNFVVWMCYNCELPQIAYVPTMRMTRGAIATIESDTYELHRSVFIQTIKNLIDKSVNEKHMSVEQGVVNIRNVFNYIVANRKMFDKIVTPNLERIIHNKLSKFGKHEQFGSELAEMYREKIFD